MTYHKTQWQIIICFSILFGYVMALPYEGPVLYALAGDYNVNSTAINLISVFFHGFGILLGGFFVKNLEFAKKFMIPTLSLAFACSVLLIVTPPSFWYVLLIVIAFTTGTAIVSFSHYIRHFFDEKKRMRMVADVLILGNVFLTMAHISTALLTPHLSFLCIEVAFFMMLVILGKINVKNAQEKTPVTAYPLSSYRFIFAFIIVITLNSGIMFSVIYPYFSVFETLESFYTNIPYILAIFILSRYFKSHKFYFLYVGLASWAIALIAYATLGQTMIGFFTVFTAMLFAAGIFDLFWWSLMASHFDYLENPAQLFGLGLALNVWGVFIGNLLSEKMMLSHFTETGISYVGLGIVMLSMLMIYPLNNKLTQIYENNSFLVYLLEMKSDEKISLVAKAQEILSNRELEVFQLLIEGKRDREICDLLYLSPHTVKSHNRNIYKKLEVQNRIELKEKATFEDARSPMSF